MWPSMWFTPTSGRSWLTASALATLTPTSSEPIRPGPQVTATASRSSQPAPDCSSAASRVGTIQRSCCRAATSGTMPPVAACSATWLATWFASIRRPPTTTATPVSSHDDSMARIRGPLIRPVARARPHDRCIAGSRELRGGHHQRVLAVIGVVAAAAARPRRSRTRDTGPEPRCSTRAPRASCVARRWRSRAPPG